MKKYSIFACCFAVVCLSFTTFYFYKQKDKEVNYDKIAIKMQALAESVYEKIPNISKPQKKDYKIVEDYLQNGSRPLHDYIEHYAYQVKSKRIKLFSEQEGTEYKIIPVNCSLEDKNNCILLFASWNELYPTSLRKLLSIIENSDFKGM